MSGAAYSAAALPGFNQTLSAGSGSIPLALLPANNAAWSISARVSRAAIPSAVEVFVGSLQTFWIGVQATLGYCQVHYGRTATEVTISTTINICDGAEHTVEVNNDPTTGVSVYIDGSLAGSSATTMTTANPSRINPIGLRNFGGSANQWGGTLDEVAIWSAVQHTGTYTPPVVPFTGGEAGLIALYHFDGNGNDSANASGFDQAKVLFSPKNWNVGAGSAKTVNSGAYFRTIFSGGSCTLQFDMTGILTPLPQVRYRIDNYGPWTVVDLSASIVLGMPADTASGPVHLLEFEVKSMTETQARWSTQATAVSLVGILLASGGVLSLPPSKAINIVALGDSITEGCRTVKALGTPDVNSHDASLTALPEIARRLGAEYGVVGFSAQGFVTAGAGAVPALTATLNLLYAGAARDWATNPPDAVFIAEGTNDTPDVTTAATTVINSLLASTPKTTKIVVFRPYNGTAHAGQLQAAIAASTAPTRCLYVDTAGMFTASVSSDNIHPYGLENITHIAPQLTAAIQAFVQPIRGARSLRTISLTLTADAAGTVPRANLTGITGAIFDQASPGALTVAADNFLNGTTDANGLFTQTVYSTLGVGAQVWLDMASADKSMAFKGLAVLS